ncbi:GDP-mannose 4,6-dehydratase [Polaribacter sp.]|nr:GDP-mannose 4,6-dehydratase [Polaribacter sp.]
MIILITGITGQVGKVFVNIIKPNDNKIIGLTRDINNSSLPGVDLYLWPKNKNEFSKFILDKKITHIVHLAGQSSVSSSFEEPSKTFNSNVILTNLILSSLESIKNPPFVYVALSSEMFGNPKSLPIREDTERNPTSPYAHSKSIVYDMISYYRKYSNIEICGGITFNHESEFRDNRFFLKSLIQQSLNVYKGKSNKVVLGNLSVSRDFSDANDVVKAIYMILKNKKNKNFIICSGKSITLKDIQEYVFNRLRLPEEVLDISPSLIRNLEIKRNYGDSSKIKEELGWCPESSIFKVIDRIIDGMI